MIEKIVKNIPTSPSEPNKAYLVENPDGKSYTRYVSDAQGNIREVKSTKPIRVKRDHSIIVDEKDSVVEIGLDVNGGNYLESVQGLINTEVENRDEAIKNAIKKALGDYLKKVNYTGTADDLKREIDDITTIVTSDDSTLASIQSIVDYIKQNKETLDTLSVSNITGLENALNGKVDKVTGKQLSTEDFTTELKDKVVNLAPDSFLRKGTYTGTASDLKSMIEALERIVSVNDSDYDTLQETVDALKKLKTSLGDISTELSNKVSVEQGKGLSQEDFTTALKTKLERLNVGDFTEKGGYLGTANDLKTLIDANTLKLNSTDPTLNTLQKLVDYVKSLSQNNSSALDTKVDKVSGKELSDNNFTNALKSKLEGIDTNTYTQKGGYAGTSQDLKNLIDRKVSVEAGKTLTTNDFTNDLKNKLEGIDTNSFLQKGGYNGTANDLNNLITAIQNKLSSNDVSLDTIQEIVNYIKNLNTQLGNKVNVESGKGLSANDFTTALKQKLERLRDPNENAVYTSNTNVPLSQNGAIISWNGTGSGTLNFDSWSQKSWCIIRNETNGNGIVTVNREIDNKTIKKDEIALMFKWDQPEVTIISSPNMVREYTSTVGGSPNANKNLSTNNTGMLEVAVDPTADNHVVRKSYVDNYKPSAIKTVDSHERVFKEITRQQYDSLGTKDPNMFYFIFN